MEQHPTDIIKTYFGPDYTTLSAETVQSMKAHLDSCADCNELYGEESEKEEALIEMGNEHVESRRRERKMRDILNIVAETEEGSHGRK